MHFSNLVNNNFTILVFLADMKMKMPLSSSPSDDQPCDLRLLTPATYLKELGVAAAAAAAGLSTQMASTATGQAQQPSAGQVVSSQLPLFKGLSLSLPRPPSQSHQDQLQHRSSTPSANIQNQLSPISMTPIPSSIGGAYSCSRCGNSYARPHSLNRHIRFECGVEPKFECPVCHKKSKHKHNLVLHMRTHQHR